MEYSFLSLFHCAKARESCQFVLLRVVSVTQQSWLDLGVHAEFTRVKCEQLAGMLPPSKLHSGFASQLVCSTGYYRVSCARCVLRTGKTTLILSLSISL